VSMRSFRVVVVTVVAAVAVSFLAAAAHAQGVPTGTSAGQCVLGCNMQKKACVQGGRTVSLACKQTCRDTVAPTELGACMKTCSSAFRTTKEMCRADHQSCKTGCKSSTAAGGSAPVDPNCLGGCGAALGECARDVATTAKTCVKGCRSAPDRLACLQECADIALAGAEACASAFEACGVGCPPAP
jgi:hypothetical protein